MPRLPRGRHHEGAPNRHKNMGQFCKINCANSKITVWSNIFTIYLEFSAIFSQIALGRLFTTEGPHTCNITVSTQTFYAGDT